MKSLIEIKYTYECCNIEISTNMHDFNYLCVSLTYTVSLVLYLDVVFAVFRYCFIKRVCNAWFY